MKTATQRLGEISREYAVRAQEYERLARDAAGNESRYRRVHAQAKLRFMHAGSSAAKADAEANADPVVAQACDDYKMSAGILDAAAKRLAQLREQVAVGRTLLVSEREQDRLSAAGVDGAP